MVVSSHRSDDDDDPFHFSEDSASENDSDAFPRPVGAAAARRNKKTASKRRPPRRKRVQKDTKTPPVDPDESKKALGMMLQPKSKNNDGTVQQQPSAPKRRRQDETALATKNASNMPVSILKKPRLAHGINKKTKSAAGKEQRPPPPSSSSSDSSVVSGQSSDDDAAENSSKTKQQSIAKQKNSDSEKENLASSPTGSSLSLSSTPRKRKSTADDDDFFSSSSKRPKPHKQYGRNGRRNARRFAKFEVNSGAPAFFGLIEGLVPQESCDYDSYLSEIFLHGRVKHLPQKGRLLELPGEAKAGSWSAEIVNSTSGILRDKLDALRHLRIQLRHSEYSSVEKLQLTPARGGRNAAPENVTVSSMNVAIGRVGSLVTQGAMTIDQAHEHVRIGSISIVAFDGFTSASENRSEAAIVSSRFLEECRKSTVKAAKCKETNYRDVLGDLLAVPSINEHGDCDAAGVSFLCQLELSDVYHLLLARDLNGHIVAVDVVFDESSAARSSLSSSSSAGSGPTASKLTEECLLKHSHEMQQVFGPSQEFDKADSVLSSASSRPPVDPAQKDSQSPIAASVDDEMPGQSPIAASTDDDAPLVETDLPEETEASPASPAVMRRSTSTPRSVGRSVHDQGASKSTVKPAASQQATVLSNPSAKPMSSRKNLVTPGLLTARAARKSSALLGSPVDASEISSEPSGKKNLLAQLERSEEDSLSSKPSSHSEESVESEYGDDSAPKVAIRKKQQARNKASKQAPPKKAPPPSATKRKSTKQTAPPKKAPPPSASKPMSRELKALQLESSGDESDDSDDASHSSGAFYSFDTKGPQAVLDHGRASTSRVAKAPLPAPRRKSDMSEKDSDSEISESLEPVSKESKAKKAGTYEDYKAARLKARMEKKRGKSGRGLHVRFEEDDGSTSNNSGASATAISRRKALDNEDDDDYSADDSKAAGANEGSDSDYEYSSGVPSRRGKSRRAVAFEKSKESVGAACSNDEGFVEDDDGAPVDFDDDEDDNNTAGDAAVTTEATPRFWPSFHDVFFGVYDDDAYEEVSQQVLAALVDESLLVDDDETLDFSLSLAADQSRHTPKSLAARLLSLLLIASFLTVVLNPAASGGARSLQVAGIPSSIGTFQINNADVGCVDETSSAPRALKSWMDWIH